VPYYKQVVSPFVVRYAARPRLSLLTGPTHRCVNQTSNTLNEAE